MVRKKRSQISGIIFAVVFVLSAIAGDSVIFGENISIAAVGGTEEQLGTETLPDSENLAEGEVSTESGSESNAGIDAEKKSDVNAASVLAAAEDAEQTETENDTKNDTENETENDTEKNVAEESAMESETTATEADFVIANVETSLNVRTEPSLEGEVIGKMYRGAKATILERGEEWTYITSGDLTGYVSSEFLMFDVEAWRGADIFGVKTATVETEILRIRRAPSLEAEILDLAKKGDELLVADEEDLDGDTATDQKNDWVAVEYKDDLTGYVSAQYVTCTLQLEEAISIEEEQRIREEKERERQREEQAAIAAKAIQEAKKKTIEKTNRSAISVSEEEVYLLAATVYMEAGNQSYDGKLAVANVVVNRLLSGIWGNSISSVVYAKGQFTGAASGLLQRYLDSGPNSGSLQAAAEALAGVNNIGDYMYFCSLRKADYSKYKKYTIIEDHCFYQK